MSCWGGMAEADELTGAGLSALRRSWRSEVERRAAGIERLLFSTEMTLATEEMTLNRERHHHGAMRGTIPHMRENNVKGGAALPCRSASYCDVECSSAGSIFLITNKTHFAFG